MVSCTAKMFMPGAPPKACLYKSDSPGECPMMLANNLFGSTNSQQNEPPLLSGISTPHRRLLNLLNVMCGTHVSTCCAMMVSHGKTSLHNNAKHVDHRLLGEPLRVRLAQNPSAMKSFSCEASGFHFADQFPQAHHANTSGV
jgi:hypothetical protein